MGLDARKIKKSIFIEADSNGDKSIDFEEFWKYAIEQGSGHSLDPVLEVRTYLDKHNLLILFESMAAALMFAKPEDPRLFLAEKLRLMKAEKQPLVTYSDLELETMYGLFDLMGKGAVKAAQANEALRVLTGRPGTIGAGEVMYDPNVSVSKGEFVDTASAALKSI